MSTQAKKKTKGKRKKRPRKKPAFYSAHEFSTPPVTHPDSAHFKSHRGLMKDMRRIAATLERKALDPVLEINKQLARYSIPTPRNFLDPPERYLEIIEGSRTVHRNRFGKVLYVTTVKASKTVKPLPEHLPLPEVAQIYEYALPNQLTEQERVDRAEAFIALYQMYGYVKPCAAAVGMSYTDIMGVIAKDPDLQGKMELADIEASLILDDMATHKAHSGDGAMIRYLMNRRDSRRTQHASGKVTVQATQSTFQHTLDTMKRLEENAAASMSAPVTLDAEVKDELVLTQEATHVD